MINWDLAYSIAIGVFGGWMLIGGTKLIGVGILWVLNREIEISREKAQAALSDQQQRQPPHS
jgi:hypothetical protein